MMGALLNLTDHSPFPTLALSNMKLPIRRYINNEQRSQQFRTAWLKFLADPTAPISLSTPVAKVFMGK
jgi:hypothetical protein